MHHQVVSTSVFNSGVLPVSPLHTIYYEQSGNPDGIPLLRIHGGPGSSSKPKHRAYFDQQKFNIILFDQRGCGQSIPLGELNQNTTQELVADIEKLRQHLQIEKWIIVAASWGSTLALLYAEQYPQYVTHLIIQGVFTGRQSEIDWMFEGAIRDIFPDQFQKLITTANLDPTKRLTPQIYQNLTSHHYDLQLTTAEAVSHWEYYLSSLEPPTINPDDEFSTADLLGTTIEHHYMFHNCFLPENYILDHASQLQSVPITIIQGRYDMVCPFITAWELYQKCPHATFIPVTAGHYSQETNIKSVLANILLASS